MKTGISAFSRLEQLGIVLMVSGICLGFYGRIVGPRIISNASDRYSSTRDEGDTISGVKNLIGDITTEIERGQKALQLEGLGQWWFFSGLGIFVVSRRYSRNTDLRDNQPDEYT